MEEPCENPLSGLVAFTRNAGTVDSSQMGWAEWEGIGDATDCQAAVNGGHGGRMHRWDRRIISPGRPREAFRPV